MTQLTRDELLELRASLKAHQRQSRRLLVTVTRLLEQTEPAAEQRHAQPEEGHSNDRDQQPR